jgi:hypothetical protein
MPAFGMVEEEPAAVVAFALSHFSTVVPCNQQFDCGKSESAAHVLKLVKWQRPGKPAFSLQEPALASRAPHPWGARRGARCQGDQPRPQFVIPCRRPSAGQSNESAEVVLTPKSRKGAAAAGGTAARELGYFM